MLQQQEELDQWLDVSGLMPPLPKQVCQDLKEKLGSALSQNHTFSPFLVTRAQFSEIILPTLQKNLDSSVVDFIVQRVEKTFFLRNQLKELYPQIVSIVGAGNFSALWLDREAFSADSMEHRALVTEAVVSVYSAQALQNIVALFYRHDIPMIPYGEGGGYNMGVTPMAPSVTISARGIDHIIPPRPSRRDPNRFEITVGAGVPFRDVVSFASRHGFVLRCQPNTPRAATGGIAGTGSNAGRQVFEVVVHGRAIGCDGTDLCFAPDGQEQNVIESEPFLLARKFFGVRNTEDVKKAVEQAKKHQRKAGSSTFSTPRFSGFQDESLPLPLSTFVGAEGTTGFIYEVTFEVEKPLPWQQASRFHFKNMDVAVSAILALKQQAFDKQPEYFEFISGQSIRRFLLSDFPTVFAEEDEAVLILATEGESRQTCETRHTEQEKIVVGAIEKLGFQVPDVLRKQDKTKVFLQEKDREEFEAMIKPREELPKKLRTKCKTDMEIRTGYLSSVLALLQRDSYEKQFAQKEDVLFGHLTPHHTAIIHWNIGGFDLYDEEQADVAWSYLEDVMNQAQRLAPAEDPYGSARFTGEHGVAGKAPFLWLNHIQPDDFARLCAVKDILDPKGLFNPETLFLRTSHARALRARLFETSTKLMREALSQGSPGFVSGVEKTSFLAEEKDLVQAEQSIIDDGLRCTRCNSCKICPVIDAEHELERDKKRNSRDSVLPSKRNILMFLERIVHMRKNARRSGDPVLAKKVWKATALMLKESSHLLGKCFYCRRCDKACPVEINIHPLTRSYHALGKLPARCSLLWRFVYERLMGDDVFKSLTYRLLAWGSLFFSPLLSAVRRLRGIPDWAKTYMVSPSFAVRHYEPKFEGKKHLATDNFVVIEPTSLVSSSEAGCDPFVVWEKEQVVFIRYRGCMDTFAHPEATRSVDTYFRDVLGVRIVDLEKKMCCGFPFAADGLEKRALQSQVASLVEIVKCMDRILSSSSVPPKIFLFSNCPTCCESLREMRTLLSDPAVCEQVFREARLGESALLPARFDFAVKDTAELALDVAKQKQQDHKNSEGLKPWQQPVPVQRKVGLKIPCHNTQEATQAQIDLLRLYFTDVSFYDRCCGLSGTARFKHPKIGTKIAEKLFGQIEDASPQAVVSGCPSCREGVELQKKILSSRKASFTQFRVSGLFEEIVSTRLHQGDSHVTTKSL